MKSVLKICSIFFITLLTFNSCQNFFNGSELKDQIDKAVEIANASEISVEINLRNKNSGKISPTGITKIKKGVPIEIEMTVTSGFSFEGNFSVYEKSNGSPKKIENPDEYVKFVRKSEYTVGTGITNYVYEATVLKNISSILIHPDITNLNVTTPPTLHSIEILNRYENSNLVDYFDVLLTMEDESGPQNEVDVYFMDKDGNILVDEDGNDSIQYTADIKDIGNGLYNLPFRIDLRDRGPAINDEVEFKIKVKVKNDGKDENGENYSSSMTLNTLLTKYTYSKTQVAVFNRLEGMITSRFPPVAYPPNASSFMDTEEGIANHSKTVRLIVLKCDEKGRDKTTDGQKMPIEYGFTQDKNKLDDPHLTDHTIPFYTTYDLESEFAEAEKLFDVTGEALYEIIDEVMEEWNVHNNTYREFLYYLWMSIDPNPIQVSEEEEEFLMNDIGMDVYYKLQEYDPGEELNNNFLKYFHNGLNNCSIIDISLPSRFDPYKDLYIKVKTDNGINGKNYEVFTFPATPKVISTQIENNELTYKLYSEDLENNIPCLYKYDEYKWNSYENNEGTFSIPDEITQNNLDYSFYVYSKNKENETYSIENKLDCYFFQDSIETVKYTVKNKSQTLEPFPSTIMPEISSDGINSRTHTITMALDKNAFNKFDNVFVEYNAYGRKKIIKLSQSVDAKFSFSISTNLIYNYANTNEYFTFYIIGSKDGRTYETEYKISKNDSRIKDNIPPEVPLQYTINGITGELSREDFELNSTGSFITLKGQFDDYESGLDIDSNNNIKVDVTFKGINHTTYSAPPLTVEFPYDKYLNIPIGHLPNGDYKVDIKICDKTGNFSGLSMPELAKFKVDRKKIPEGYELLNPSGNNISLKFSDTGEGTYLIESFDGTNWKNIDSGEISKGKSSDQKNLGKSGLVRVFVNERTYLSFDNTVSYPLYAHVPEYPVSTRDYQLLKNSLRIYSDKPFFVHILQSDIDLGNNAKTQEEKIEQWENVQLFTSIYPKVPKPIKPKYPDIEEPKEEDYPLIFEDYEDEQDYFEDLFEYGYNREAYNSAVTEYEEIMKLYSNEYHEYDNKMNAYGHVDFIGSEINPVYETADHSVSPYVYNFPWDKLTKKYAVAIIYWADNKKYLVPIDLSMKD